MSLPTNAVYLWIRRAIEQEYLTFHFSPNNFFKINLKFPAVKYKYHAKHVCFHVMVKKNRFYYCWKFEDDFEAFDFVDIK